MNTLIFSGHVVRTPRYNDGGKSPVLGFTLCSQRKWRDKEFKTYCDCSVFGERAKELNGAFREGDYLQVQGEGGGRGYKAKDSDDVKGVLTCNVLSVEVVNAKSSPSPVSAAAGVAAAGAAAVDGGDDGVPF